MIPLIPTFSRREKEHSTSNQQHRGTDGAVTTRGLQRCQSLFVVRLFGNLVYQLRVGHVVVFVDDDDGAAGQPLQFAVGELDAVIAYLQRLGVDIKTK